MKTYGAAAGLLADAYAKTGQLERADQLFAEVTQISTTPEIWKSLAGQGLGADSGIAPDKN